MANRIMALWATRWPPDRADLDQPSRSRAWQFSDLDRYAAFAGNRFGLAGACWIGLREKFCLCVR
jgi:hypothetical protein